MHATGQVTCPKCGQADAVRKVSAIVAEGTRTGETGGIALGLGDRSLDLMPFVSTSTSRSALAAKLAPPAKPAKPLGNGWTAAFTVGRSALVVFVGLLLAGATLCSFPLLINTYSANRLLLLIPFAVLALFIMAAFVWVIRSAIRDVRAWHRDSDSYETRLQVWRSAVERWQHLYYCARDDGIFTLNDSALIPDTRLRVTIVVTPVDWTQG